MSASHTQIARKELAYRSTNGIDVFLLWNPANDTLAVLVMDENADSFELDVTRLRGTRRLRPPLRVRRVPRAPLQRGRASCSSLNCTPACTSRTMPTHHREPETTVADQ